MIKNVSIALLFFLLGLVVASIYWLPSQKIQGYKDSLILKHPHIYLNIKIDSEKQIEKLTIEYPTGITYSEFSNLKKFDAIQKNIPHKGEGVYRLRVKFSDGSELIDAEHYIEGGYRIFHSIENDTILTQYNF